MIGQMFDPTVLPVMSIVLTIAEEPKWLLQLSASSSRRTMHKVLQSLARSFPPSHSLSLAFLYIREEIVMEIESDEIDVPLDECFRSEEASYIVDRHVLWP